MNCSSVMHRRVTQRNIARQGETIRTVTDARSALWHTGSMAKKQKTRHFIKEWRKHRDLSQEELADRMGITRGYVSQVENGKRRYDQLFLEAAAQALNCDPADLLIRDPTDKNAPWSIWDQIDPLQREQAIKVLETFKKTGTDGK